jgi:hypothetical protein
MKKTTKVSLMSQKKNDQLGMNVGTASNRLVKDLLFSHVKDTPCYHCGGKLGRDNFSIEHKTPWLDSEDPLGLFFDLDNITFSHLSCNSGAARKPTKKYESACEQKKAGHKRYRESLPKEVRQQRRKEQYLRTGK